MITINFVGRLNAEMEQIILWHYWWFKSNAENKNVKNFEEAYFPPLWTQSFTSHFTK